MASPAYKIHANTAAELLHYTEYDKPGPGGTSEKCWSRWASADENFNVGDAGGNRYLIRFDSNFSKKHLATFSKKEYATETEKWLQPQQPGQQGKDEENWNRAQKQLLDNKILKTLGIRSGTADEAKCRRCGHPKKNNPDGTGHSNAGNCRVPGCVTCIGGYLSSYVESRRDENKPLINPYAGASASQSSCIVLNWIPKNEFELVVGNSIVAADPGNTLPNSVVGHGGALIPLTWTFAGRPGAVRHAENGVIDLENGTWSTVGARKANGGPPGITATWTIVHWEPGAQG